MAGFFNGKTAGLVILGVSGALAVGVGLYLCYRRNSRISHSGREDATDNRDGLSAPLLFPQTWDDAESKLEEGGASPDASAANPEAAAAPSAVSTPPIGPDGRFQLKGHAEGSSDTRTVAPAVNLQPTKQTSAKRTVTFILPEPEKKPQVVSQAGPARSLQGPPDHHSDESVPPRNQPEGSVDLGSSDRPAPAAMAAGEDPDFYADLQMTVKKGFRRGSAAAAAAAAAAAPPLAGDPGKGALEGEGVNIELEVITGPAAGSKASCRAANLDPWPSLTIGRVKGNDLPLNDSEVSGKHARITWNALSATWEVVDRGSLNGTWVNETAIAMEGDSRREGQPMQLRNGDILTCGQTSRILVRIAADTLRVETLAPEAPFEVAVACDPMKARKGGRALPMEDVSHCEWPLRGGLLDLGIFCIFDGHAGRAAAENVKRILPDRLSELLLAEDQHVALRRRCDATDILREAFRQTEEALPNEDEGCTGTVLLVWRGDPAGAAEGTANGGADGCGPHTGLWIQAANLGDSHCVFGSEVGETVLTEDHRLTGPVEKQRLASIGKPLPDGATRLCGMNIARVFGDKYLKQQDVGLSADPFIHPAMPLPRPPPSAGPTPPHTIAVIASDGLWDVMSPKRSIQVAYEALQANLQSGSGGHAGAMASALVTKAKLAKTHDNTTVVAIDFGSDP